MKRGLLLVLAVLAVTVAPARAELTVFKSFTGNVGVSTDGFGSTTQTGTISASVPAGATVLGAYLYTSSFGGLSPVGGTLNGTAVAYGPLVVNPSVTILSSARADVTSIVKPIIDSGPGGTYNFTVTETSTSQDGEALVVVYQLASLPVSTVGILDGFSAAGGDSTSINFADPLDPTEAGFFAEMRLGIGFSCCNPGPSNQRSFVSVNGTQITQNAGGNDDGLGAASNGQLITVGGFDDPFSPLLPSYSQDKERYNLVPQISLGDTTIKVDTNNPSFDDNIFLAVFHVAGIAGVNEPPPDPDPDPDPDPEPSVPEPSMLMLAGVALAAGIRRHRATH